MSSPDKTFLVVGGSSGIGAEIVRSLLGLGYEVRVASRTPDGTHGVTPIAWDATAAVALLDDACKTGGTFSRATRGKLYDVECRPLYRRTSHPWATSARSPTPVGAGSATRECP